MSAASRNQLFGEGRQQAGHGATKNAQQHIDDATRHSGGVPPVGISMGLAPHTYGGSDGTQVQRKGTEGRQHQGCNTCEGQDSGHRNTLFATIPCSLDGRHTGHVL